jgi:peptidoglycan/xylan/chitin deacetylase (PgdA/CDA1 family)
MTHPSTLYAVFTMDCEQLAADSLDGGPADWALSERSIRGFAAELSARGYPATFFIIPQTAERHAELFLELQRAGFEPGLHQHAPDQGWPDHLGGLPPELQQRALTEAGDRWSQALGQGPRAFRGGNFSANDMTFPLLVALGYTSASASSPRRQLLARRAMWDGAPPYPHRAHAANRLLEGDLPLVEVPGATHPSLSRPDSPHLPMEARIEWGTSEQHEAVIRAHLDWQLAADAPLLASVIFTHNTHEYSDPHDLKTQRLRALLAILDHEAERRGLKLVPATVGTVAQAVLSTPPLRFGAPHALGPVAGVGTLGAGGRG